MSDENKINIVQLSKYPYIALEIRKMHIHTYQHNQFCNCIIVFPIAYSYYSHIEMLKLFVYV